MTYATARTETVQLALALLDAGEDKNDLYSVFLQLATTLLTVNDQMIRTELQKAMSGNWEQSEPDKYGNRETIREKRKS